MKKKKKKSFDKEFKISAVKIALEGKESLSSIEKDLGTIQTEALSIQVRN